MTDIIEALTYANQNHSHVINLSLSGNQFHSAEAAAITACFNSCIVLVSSAGNTGRQETIRYPAGHEGVLAISNLQQNGNTLAPTSSFGVYVDFTAPGTDIVSLAENNAYRNLSGTSMFSTKLS